MICPKKELTFPIGQPPAGQDVLWRVEANRYSIVLDADADVYGVSDPTLEAIWYQVRKRTPKGARLDFRFVLLTATKRYACNTIAEALESFKARRVRQIAILEGKLRKARQDLELVL